MSGKENPEQTKIVKQAMAEMEHNVSPGQPGISNVVPVQPSETAKKMSKATLETLKKLGKAAN